MCLFSAVCDGVFSLAISLCQCEGGRIRAVVTLRKAIILLVLGVIHLSCSIFCTVSWK
jgi:hypothetical protein